MHDKRARMIAVITLVAICTSIGYWLFLWSTDVFLYWGISLSVRRLLAALVACAALSTILIHPIPIKVITIATINLILLSLFSTLAQLILRRIWPVAAAVGWLWQGGIAAIGSCAAILVYGFFHGKRLVIKTYVVDTLIPVIGGELRIALISDVHMGMTIDEVRLQKQMDRLSAEKPDLLIIAGDLVDDRTSPAQMQAACAVVGSLPTTYGTFFAYGNHDLANHGPKPPYTKAELDQALTDHGVRIMDDQIHAVAGLTLIGRHDAAFARNAERASLEHLLVGVDTSKPIILIDHQPREMKAAATAGVTLQVSGHTHAGQVWPMSWFAQVFAFSYGHRVISGMHAIISSGMGNRGNVLRSGCTAEMVLIHLRNSKD
jgi:predicted MPP superfamily phosphohydrolase